MADPSKDDLLRQITQSWEAAQRQLAELRQAVERTGDMAKLKLETEVVRRDLDRALHALGESVWQMVKAGTLKLPSQLDAALSAVEEVERRQAAQTASISDILSEGPELAGRLQSARENSKPKTAVAAKGKKR